MLTQLRIAAEVHDALLMSAPVYAAFGTHGGFLAVMQLLSALQLVSEDASPARAKLRSEVLVRGLAILSDAITYSASNRAVFEQTPGWDGLVESLRHAMKAQSSYALAARMTALLFGLGCGDVSAGAQRFAARWEAVQAEQDEINKPSMAGSANAFLVVHPYAIACALQTAEEDGPASALAAYQAVAACMDAGVHNEMVLRHSPLVAPMLHAWIAEEGGEGAAHRRRADARAKVLDRLLHHGIRTSEGIRAIFDRIQSGSSAAQLRWLQRLRSVAVSSYERSAWTFETSVGSADGLVLSDLPRPFPASHADSAGYTLVLQIQLHSLEGTGQLPLFRVGAADGIGLYVDLSSQTLAYATGGTPVVLPRAQLTLGQWHHVVLTHARAPAGMASTLHAYLDGKRVSSILIDYPSQQERPVPVWIANTDLVATGRARWSLHSVMLHDSVVPASIPLLFALLPPDYQGNGQDALFRFLSYTSRAKMLQRLEELAFVAGPRTKDGVPHTHAFQALEQALYRGGANIFPLDGFYFHLSARHTIKRGQDEVLVLNQAISSVDAAVRYPYGHARVQGTPALSMPTALCDAIWAQGGTTDLLCTIQAATTPAALTASLGLFLLQLQQSWRLAEEAERVGAYGILGMLLREKAPLLEVDAWEALCTATAVSERLCNVHLYRAVFLDTYLWAQTTEEVQRAYLAHFPPLLSHSTHGTSNALNLAKMPVMKRLLVLARRLPHRLATLHELLIEAILAVLSSQLSTRTVQALLPFVVVNIAPWTPPAVLTSSSRTSESLSSLPVECSQDLVPKAVRAPDGRLELFAIQLLHAVVENVQKEQPRASRLAQYVQAKWLLLLLRPGIAPTITVPTLALTAMLLEPHTPLLDQWETLKGFRILERSLPLVWAAPGVLASLWRLFLGPRPPKRSLYATYAVMEAPSAPAFLLHQPDVLRTLFLCLAEGLQQEARTRIPLSRRASWPCTAHRLQIPTLARRVLLRESVQLLQGYAHLRPFARLLLLAPILSSVLQAVLPALDPPCDVEIEALCMDLLGILVDQLSKTIKESGTLTILTTIHKSMPTSDPVMQSRLCARLYQGILARMVPMDTTPKRTTLSTLAALLKMASNESIGDLRLQSQVFETGTLLLQLVQTYTGLLPARATAKLAVALQRNILHNFASEALTVPSPALAFCAAHASAIQGDDVFWQCTAFQALERLERNDPDATAVWRYIQQVHPALLQGSDAPGAFATSSADVSLANSTRALLEATWTVAAADQSAFVAGLYRDRARLFASTLFKPSARAQALLAMHTRITGWHTTLQDAEQARMLRLAQDAKDDTIFLRRVWTEAQDALALQRGMPHDWQLEATDGPGGVRRKLGAVPLSERFSATGGRHPFPASVATELAAEVDQGTADAQELDDDAVTTHMTAPIVAQEPKTSPSPSTPETTSWGDEGTDSYRHILRSLKPGDTVETVLNTSRVLGMDAQSSLLVAGTHHLYLLDGYFQRPNGDVVLIDTAPPAERDQLITAALRTRPSVESTSLAVWHWHWKELRLCMRRAWLHRPTALELFFMDGQSSFLVFSESAQMQTLLSLLRTKGPSALQEAERLTEGVAEPPPAPPALAPTRLTHRVLGRNTSGGALTRAWQAGTLSNADYLVTLNTVAGRTMNDVSQFPIFPWVLADYTSGTLDLEAPSTFRDLSRPIGAQTEARRGESRECYQQLQEVHMEPFHYGTHYSTASSVCGFLVRLRPYTQWLLELQDGRFDFADRMFSSVGRAYFSASGHARSDVRELIPELFFVPELFVNENGLDLGRTQDGQEISEVELPPWAHNDPWLFVQRHREALESPLVSAQLHHWIDLIFGYQSRGEKAVEACNVFHPTSYADHVDLEQIGPVLEREATAQVIHNFGQTPNALFAQPHPPRAADKGVADLAITPHLLLQAHASAMQLSEAVYALYGGLGHLSGLLRNQALLADKYLVTWGSMDGSIRLTTPEQGTHTVEQVARTRITTVAVAGTSLMCVGAEDGTVQLYRLATGSPHLELLLAWTGHRAPVTVSAASIAWQRAVTGSQDSTVMLWDVNTRQAVRTLTGHDQPVSCIAVDDEGGWIATSSGAEVCVYSVNGHLLARQSTRSAAQADVHTLLFCARGYHTGHVAVLLTGHAGVILVWYVVANHEESAPGTPRWRLSLQMTLATGSAAPVTSLSTPTLTTVLAGDAEGVVHSWSLPGYAQAYGSAKGVCMNPACRKRFTFLEPRRTCGGCGGSFCASCMLPPDPRMDRAKLGPTRRFCRACAETLQARQG